MPGFLVNMLMFLGFTYMAGKNSIAGQIMKIFIKSVYGMVKNRDFLYDWRRSILRGTYYAQCFHAEWRWDQRNH